ncbi:MAG: hypothetical protein J7L55_04645 [Desulfurococcales archaeon]|nr:hypothetical protein [Desulfurococcales archaeon]
MPAGRRSALWLLMFALLIASSLTSVNALVSYRGGGFMTQGDYEVDKEVVFSYDGSDLVAKLYKHGELVCTARYTRRAYGVTTDSLAIFNLNSFICDDAHSTWLMSYLYWDVKWGSKVAFALDTDTVAKGYQILSALERFGSSNTTAVIVDYSKAPPAYSIYPFDDFFWEPILIYRPENFTVEIVNGIKLFYDDGVRNETLQYVKEALGIVNELKEAYGPTIFEPYLFIFVSMNIPDIYGHEIGGHSMGSTKFMRDGFGNTTAVIAIHETAHSWFTDPYVKGSPYELKEGGAEFTGWYFSRKYFPQQFAKYMEGGWVCHNLGDPYFSGATKIIAQNYYIEKLSQVAGKNLTIFNIFRDYFGNATFYKVFTDADMKTFILEAVPHYLAADLGVDEGVLKESAGEIEEILSSIPQHPREVC